MVRKLLLIICLLFLEAMVVEAQELQRYKSDNGKYGYKDKNGKVIISPKYDYASLDFDEGLAVVRLNKKYGFIEKTGNELIPLQYGNADRFSEGWAAVQREVFRWEFIDKNNQTALALPEYIDKLDFTSDFIFSEGLTAVRVNLPVYDQHYYDVSRPEVALRIAKELNLSSPMTDADREKLKNYLVKIETNTLTNLLTKISYSAGYIDKIGNFLFDPHLGYDIAYPFHEGFAVVGKFLPGNSMTTLDPKYNLGYIDKSGRLVVPLNYEEVRPFKEGLAAVKRNGLWGFVNKEGKEIVPTRLSYVYNFNKGFAIVDHDKIIPGNALDSSEKITVRGLINKEGKVVVPIAQNDVVIEDNGMVTVFNGSLETRLPISAFEEFNRGFEAANQQNFGEAARQFLKSAEKGYGTAMTYLGFLYFEGKGVEKSSEKGLEWMQKGANNDLYSMLQLGLYYVKNVPADYTKAFQWLKKASENDYAPSMGDLALLYATGQGTAQNGAEAKKWLDRGVELGDAHCMFNYGLMYFQGSAGFTKDPGVARQWLNRAEKAGHPQAKAALAELTRLGF